MSRKTQQNPIKPKDSPSPRLFSACARLGAEVNPARVLKYQRESAYPFHMARVAERTQPVKEPLGSTDAREVMNIRQASEYLGVSPDTLYKYVGENKIPAFKLGNRWRFKKSKLDEWMEEQSSEAEGQSKRKAKARAAAH
jgi:excisionase family DNA binding protein